MDPFTRFIGGSPLEVLIKLVLLSFVVGIVLSALNIDPLDILTGIQHIGIMIYELGFKSVELAFHYLLVGAAIVVPIWFIRRLLKMFEK